MPSQTEKARRYVNEARRLEDIDSLEAIPPLARLSRRVPGWLTILFSAVLTTLPMLLIWALLIGLFFHALTVITRALQGFVITVYPDYSIVWVGIFITFSAHRLWFNDRWRDVLDDPRFNLLPGELGWLWMGLLWPLHILAKMLRLGVALLVLALVLALPTTTLTSLVQISGSWRTEPMVMLGFTAGLLYLILGLLRGWRRDARLRWRPKGTRPSKNQWLIAIIIAIVMGGIVAYLSPVHKLVAWGVSGWLYFLVWSLWLPDLDITHPRQLSKIARLEISFSQTQTRFLAFVFLVLWIAGGTITVYLIATHWTALQAWFPNTFINRMQQLCHRALSPTACVARLPWQVSFRISNYLIIAAVLRLLNLDLPLAQLFIWPFFTLRTIAQTMTARVRAQLAVWRAIHRHRRRNRDLVGKRGRQALCRQHLARFKRRKVRLAYGIRWYYWSCRQCDTDVLAISGVKTLRGVFDLAMKTDLKEGEITQVNLLNPANAPLDLQEIYVAQIKDDHDIESFITRYENFYQANIRKIPPLSRIKLHIASDSNLGDNQRNMLVSKCRE